MLRLRNKTYCPLCTELSPSPPILGCVSLTSHFHGLHLRGVEVKQESVEGGRKAEIYFWLNHESALWPWTSPFWTSLNLGFLIWRRKLEVTGDPLSSQIRLFREMGISPLPWSWLKALLVPGVFAFFAAPLHWVQADFSCSEFRVGSNRLC